MMERNAYDTLTAIHDLAAPEMANGQSSNGRVSVSSAGSVLPKGVYIKDGRKVMVK